VTDLPSTSLSDAAHAEPSVRTHIAPADRLRELELGIPDDELTKFLSSFILTVAASKGGVTKTTLARELGWWLDAVTVDLDWDLGGLTRLLGYLYENRKNAPLLDAFDTGRTPRPLKGGPYKSDFVPAHPDLSENQPTMDDTSTHLERWSGEWQRPVLVDTHPGGHPMAYGAMRVSRVIVVPTLLEHQSLMALEGQLDEMREYNILIIPTKVPPTPSALMIDRLQKISTKFDVPVGPPISRVEPLARRTLSMAVSAKRPVPKQYVQFVDDMRAVVKAVILHGIG
jgi:chromosome partitioning protein